MHKHLPLTLRQLARLRDIVADIERAPRHPSPAFRARLARFTQQQIDFAADAVRGIIRADDAWSGSLVIGAWHRGSVAGVVAFYAKAQKG